MRIMAKLKLLLFDAGIVIGLHELGVWDKVVKNCEITLTATVAYDEVLYWRDNSGRKKSIEIEGDIKSGRIKCVDVQLSQIEAFRQRFSSNYLDSLDDGEAESLAFMLESTESSENWCISSSDAIVFKVLGRLALGHQGISLEEVLKQVGLTKKIEWKYCKDFRVHYTTKGEQDSITGMGMK